MTKRHFSATTCGSLGISALSGTTHPLTDTSYREVLNGRMVEKAQAEALKERNKIERERNALLARFLTAYELQAGFLPVEKKDAPSEVVS